MEGQEQVWICFGYCLQSLKILIMLLEWLYKKRENLGVPVADLFLTQMAEVSTYTHNQQNASILTREFIHHLTPIRTPPPIGPKPLFTLSLKWKRVGITAIQVFVRRIKDKWWWEALKWAMFTYQKGLFALVIKCFQDRLLISHRKGEELESMKECIMGPMRK